MNRHKYMVNDKSDMLKAGDVFTLNSYGLEKQKATAAPSKIILHYLHYDKDKRKWGTQFGVSIYERQLLKLYDKTGFEPLGFDAKSLYGDI